MRLTGQLVVSSRKGGAVFGRLFLDVNSLSPDGAVLWRQHFVTPLVRLRAGPGLGNHRGSDDNPSTVTNLCAAPKPRRNRLKLLMLGLVLSFGLTGCCHWTDKSGTRHTLILGVGVVSVNESKSEAARVIRANALGIIADAGGVTAGFSSRISTSVPDGAEDVRIEASQKPFAPLKIEVQKAQLNQTNKPRKPTQ